VIYQPRVVDTELIERLAAAKIVVIEGPKSCGKTETAKQVAKSSVSLDTDINARQAMDSDPRLVLVGETPRLIDEWQVDKRIWNYARQVSDDRGKPGQFIFAGSSVPNDDTNRHTVAGRFSFLRMRPMTFFETGNSTGSNSLATLMEGKVISTPDSGMTTPKLSEIIAIGGWPAHQNLSLQAALRASKDYLKQVREVDVQQVTGTRRDTVKLERFMKSLARNTATEVNFSVLAADTGGTGGEISRPTVRGYLEALERLMIIENQPIWNTHLRSKAELRKTPKVHFVDPSLALAAVSGSPERLLSDLRFMGFLFESVVIRDLRVYSQPLDGEIFHYRDNFGVEVDAIVQLADGRWGAFEVKLGQGAIEQAAKKLLDFRSVIDRSKTGEPAIMAVITGTGYAYLRTDGIAVIPIGTMGP
jgi:predicted AAA+ superfamily ATPase